MSDRRRRDLVSLLRRARADPGARLLGLPAVPARLRGRGLRRAAAGAAAEAAGRGLRRPPGPRGRAARARDHGLLILLPVLSSLLILVQQASVFLDWLRTQLPLEPGRRAALLAGPARSAIPGMRPWLLWVQAQVTPAVEGWFAQLVRRRERHPAGGPGPRHRTPCSTSVSSCCCSSSCCATVSGSAASCGRSRPSPRSRSVRSSSTSSAP